MKRRGPDQTTPADESDGGSTGHSRTDANSSRRRMAAPGAVSRYGNIPKSPNGTPPAARRELGDNLTLTGGPSAYPAPLGSLSPSPKRGEAERKGLHTWLPYYAGFSEAFVSSALRDLDIDENSLVLDPMNGSGTTTVVCQRQGVPSLGTELNPVTAAVAAAKDLSGPARWHLKRSIASTIDRARSLQVPDELDDAALQWFSQTTLNDLQRLRVAIMTSDHSDGAPLHPALRGAVLPDASIPDGSSTHFLQAALLITARQVASASTSKNPTWIKPLSIATSQPSRVFESFLSVAQSLAEALHAEMKPTTLRMSTTLCADARQLPIRKDTFGAVVTSPPYLTRIDYAVSTAPELALLGYASPTGLRSIRSALMGSTCITGGPYEARLEWGDHCLHVLNTIGAHPSKASATYYLKTHIQYFRDAADITGEALRVLAPGASGIFVIQDSWYKDIPIVLADIYREMALNMGAVRAEVIGSHPVRSHMGLVNTRARRHAKGELFERVLAFSKGR